jgi:hypothetical protein
MGADDQQYRWILGCTFGAQRSALRYGSFLSCVSSPLQIFNSCSYYPSHITTGISEIPKHRRARLPDALAWDKESSMVVVCGPSLEVSFYFLPLAVGIPCQSTLVYDRLSFYRIDPSFRIPVVLRISK